MTLTSPDDRVRAALLFGGVLALIVFAEHCVTALPAFSQGPALPAAVAFDLLVGVPALFYFLVIRRCRLPLASLAGAVGACLALAFWLIPVAQQQPLRALWFLPAVLECIVLVVVATKARRLVRAYREARTHALSIGLSLRAAVHTLGPVGVLLLAEIDLLRYALLGWRALPDTAVGAASFSNHRESGFVAFIIMVGVALAVETAGLHLLIGHWSPALAQWVLWFDAYAVVTCVAHGHAVRLLPALLSPDCLTLRVGCMWQLTVPRAALVAVEPLRDHPAPHADTLNLTRLLFTAPNLLLTFAEPVAVAGPYGSRRTARRVAVYLDQPQQFIAAVKLSADSFTR